MRFILLGWALNKKEKSPLAFYFVWGLFIKVSKKLEKSIKLKKSNKLN
jgi:hypothetical protein